MDIRLVQPALPQMARVAAGGSVSAKSGDGAAALKPASADVPVQETKGPTSDETRKALVQEAAQNLTNTYVVSDVKFTIFKDSSGQYITRFTNLRDGKVSYIPEYELLASVKTHAPDTKLLNIDA